MGSSGRGRAGGVGGFEGGRDAGRTGERQQWACTNFFVRRAGPRGLSTMPLAIYALPRMFRSPTPPALFLSPVGPFWHRPGCVLAGVGGQWAMPKLFAFPETS